MPWMTKVIVGLAMYRAVETHCHHIVQNMSVAAESEEALIEWLIINTCMDGDGLFQPRCD